MKKILTMSMVCFFAVMIACSGCGVKKADSSREAIDNAKAIDSVEKQADYLVKQAEAFYKSKEYKDAINSAQYVVRNLDAESKEAREILQKAKDDMAQAARDKLKSLGK